MSNEEQGPDQNDHLLNGVKTERQFDLYGPEDGQSVDMLENALQHEAELKVDDHLSAEAGLATAQRHEREGTAKDFTNAVRIVDGKVEQVPSYHSDMKRKMANMLLRNTLNSEQAYEFAGTEGVKDGLEQAQALRLEAVEPVTGSRRERRHAKKERDDAWDKSRQAEEDSLKKGAQGLAKAQAEAIKQKNVYKAPVLR